MLSIQQNELPRMNNEADPIISLEGISKTFYTEELETRALQYTNLEVRRGEYLCISGPSGSGKSTLLSILGLLDVPTEGIFRLNGRDVHSVDSSERARIRNREIGFIFQAFNLIGDLTVEENIALPMTYRKDISHAERKERTSDAMNRVGMIHRAKHFPGQLSGGQQQRVAVARAFAGRPSILLADEPTGNLDSKSGDAVMSLLAELNDCGSTICMVTHDARYSDSAGRNVGMMDGRIVEDVRTSSDHMLTRTVSAIDVQR